MPLLLGTVRAFGRDTDPLVFPHLFPCESDSLSAVPLTSPTDKKQNKIKLDQTINIPSHFFSEVLHRIFSTVESTRARPILRFVKLLLNLYDLMKLYCFVVLIKDCLPFYGT